MSVIFDAITGDIIITQDNDMPPFSKEPQELAEQLND